MMEDAMNVKVNVKRKFIVNGKEYGSVEEMPEAIRQAYEKAVANTGSREPGNITSIASSKIVFNGQEYASVDAMPPDVRQMYETVMKTVSEGKISVTGNVDFKFGRKVADLKNAGGLDSYDMSNPIAPKPFFSPRILIVAAALIALMIGIYFLVNMGGSR
jgi:hypothetical protein